MKTIIIEDEINAFEYLSRLTTEVNPKIEIIHHLDSVEDSINWLFQNKDKVDLAFLDIQLSDGLSFEIFRHLDLNFPIIFTTAYDEYALKAFKLNSIDYLLKPITREDLYQALNKLEKVNGSNKENTFEIQKVLDGYSNTKRNRFLVKRGSYFEFVNANDVSFIHSEDSLTFLYMPDGRRHLYSKSVGIINDELDGDTFFQINRKQIININSVKKIHPYLNQRLKLDLGSNDGGVEFVVSRNRTMDFKHWVDR